MNLDRRSALGLIASGSLALLRLSGTDEVSAATTSEQKQPLLVSASDPSFNALAEQFFPGVTSRKQFASLRAISALVINAQALRISAYAVRWRTTLKNGTTKEIGRRVVNLPTYVSPPQSDHLDSAVLPALQAAFITPFGVITSAQYRRRLKTQKIMSFGPFSRNGRPKDHARRFDRQRRIANLPVVASLDAFVIGENISGRLTENLKSHYEIHRNAEHDQAVRFLQVLAIVPSNQQTALLDHLEEQLQFWASTSGVGRKKLYCRARVIAVRRLRVLLRRRGVEYTRQEAELHANRTRVELNTLFS